MNKSLGGGNASQGRLYKEKVVQTMELVKNKADYRRMRGTYINVMWFGMLIALAGQGFATFWFGWAWAISIIQEPKEWFRNVDLGIDAPPTMDHTALSNRADYRNTRAYGDICSYLVPFCSTSLVDWVSIGNCVCLGGTGVLRAPSVCLQRDTVDWALVAAVTTARPVL